jgi:hypothetical protein
MTDLVLLVYALCGIVTFWAVFTGAAGATDDDPPTSNAAAAVSLAASVVWPLVLLGAIQVSVLAMVGSLATPRPS